MSCCTPTDSSGTGRCFTRFSKRYAKQFRKKGPEKIQQYILEGIREAGISHKHILDIGCGVGTIHLTLLNEGAASATGVDRSAGMLEQARTFAGERGLAGRTSYHLGDFVDLGPDLPAADITVLDKVVCCYEHLDDLVARSTEKTKELYTLTHPRNNALVKFFFQTQIFFLKLFRADFHPFWHDWGQMRSNIRSRGFRPVYERATFLWDVAVFQRT